MIRLFFSGIFYLLLLFSFAGCINNNEEELYTDCSTDNISFTIHVSPYIENNCISCHNQNLASGGIDYSTFEGVKEGAINGNLLGSIKHDSGFEAMPPNEPKTDDCKISQMEAWINQGIQNN